MTASRLERGLSSAGYWGFNLSLGISAAFVFGLLALSSDARWVGWLKLGLGIVLAAEGLLLASNWRRGRALVLWRIRRRGGRRPVARPPVRGLLARGLADPALQLLGAAWLAAGVFAAVLGLASVL